MTINFTATDRRPWRKPWPVPTIDEQPDYVIRNARRMMTLLGHVNGNGAMRETATMILDQHNVAVVAMAQLREVLDDYMEGRAP